MDKKPFLRRTNSEPKHIWHRFSLCKLPTKEELVKIAAGGTPYSPRLGRIVSNEPVTSEMLQLENGVILAGEDDVFNVCRGNQTKTPIRKSLRYKPFRT